MERNSVLQLFKKKARLEDFELKMSYRVERSELSDFVTEFSGTLIAKNCGDVKLDEPIYQEIGYIEGNRLSVELAHATGRTMLEECRHFPCELPDVAGLCIKETGAHSSRLLSACKSLSRAPKDILYISELFLERSFRGTGLGNRMIKDALMTVGSGCGALLLSPYPRQFLMGHYSREKALKYQVSCGELTFEEAKNALTRSFTQLGLLDLDEDYLVLDVNGSVKQIEEIEDIGRAAMLSNSLLR